MLEREQFVKYKRIPKKKVKAKVAQIKAELSEEYVGHIVSSSAKRKTVDILVETRTTRKYDREKCEYMMAHRSKVWSATTKLLRGECSTDRDRGLVGIALMLLGGWTCAGTTLFARIQAKENKKKHKAFTRQFVMPPKFPKRIRKTVCAALRRLLKPFYKNPEKSYGWKDRDARVAALEYTLEIFQRTD